MFRIEDDRLKLRLSSEKWLSFIAA